MPFNINEFKSTLNKYGGPARKSLFVLDIGALKIFNNGMNVSDLRFFCQTASIPGLNYSVTDYYPNSFGIRQTVPIAMSPDQLNVVFMVDSDQMVLRFFHQWMQSIINYNYANGPFSQIENQLPYEVGYRNDFSTTASIKHYSTDSEDRYYEYVFADVFPTQVGPIDVSWSDSNSFSTVTVNFTYSHMITSGSRFGSPTERFSRGTGFLDFLNIIGFNGQAIDQGGLPTTVQDAINTLTRTTTSLYRFNTGVNQIRSGLNNIGNIFT